MTFWLYSLSEPSDNETAAPSATSPFAAGSFIAAAGRVGVVRRNFFRSDHRFRCGQLSIVQRTIEWPDGQRKTLQSRFAAHERSDTQRHFHGSFVSPLHFCTLRNESKRDETMQTSHLVCSRNTIQNGMQGFYCSKLWKKVINISGHKTWEYILLKENSSLAPIFNRFINENYNRQTLTSSFGWYLQWSLGGRKWWPSPSRDQETAPSLVLSTLSDLQYKYNKNIHTFIYSN